MDGLIVVSFHDRRRAAQAFDWLWQMNDKLVIELEDAVIVHRDQHGNLEYDQDLTWTLDKGLIGAGLRRWLRVFVAISFALGMDSILAPTALCACVLLGLIGVVAGALDAGEDAAWWKDRLCVPKCLVPEVVDDVSPGDSAVVAWVDSAGLEMAAPMFRGFGGKVVRMTLPVAKLEAALTG